MEVEEVKGKKVEWREGEKEREGKDGKSSGSHEGLRGIESRGPRNAESLGAAERLRVAAFL